MWGFWANIAEMFLFIPPFLSNSPTGQTVDHIFTLNSSNNADSRKGVPFWLSLILHPILGDQIAQKPQFLWRE